MVVSILNARIPPALMIHLRAGFLVAGFQSCI